MQIAKVNFCFVNPFTGCPKDFCPTLISVKWLPQGSSCIDFESHSQTGCRKNSHKTYNISFSSY